MRERNQEREKERGRRGNKAGERGRDRYSVNLRKARSIDILKRLIVSATLTFRLSLIELGNSRASLHPGKRSNTGSSKSMARCWTESNVCGALE
jgi:hypothetical protein